LDPFKRILGIFGKVEVELCVGGTYITGIFFLFSNLPNPKKDPKLSRFPINNTWNNILGFPCAFNKLDGSESLKAVEDGLRLG
jgi:hypothetical protein